MLQENEGLKGALKDISDKQKNDVLFINDSIEEKLFEKIVEEIKKNKKTDKLIVILITPGGSPHYAFKIVSFLQDTYKEGYEQYIVERCKSAGTLIACGANKLTFFFPYGEIGPLDMQICSRIDFQYQQISALSVFSYLQHLQRDAIRTFFNLIPELRQRYTMESSVKICCNVVKSIYEPICQQLDAYSIGEMSRTIDLSKKYINKVNEKHHNIKEGKEEVLVVGYPDHGFVIDYKEATSLFKNVELSNSNESLDFLVKNCRITGDKFLFVGYDNNGKGK